MNTQTNNIRNLPATFLSNLILTTYIFTRGETYAIVLINPKQAKEFVANYPADVRPGYSPEFPEPIFDQMDLGKTRGLGASNEDLQQ